MKNMCDLPISAWNKIDCKSLPNMCLQVEVDSRVENIIKYKMRLHKYFSWERESIFELTLQDILSVTEPSYTCLFSQPGCASLIKFPNENLNEKSSLILLEDFIGVGQALRRGDGWFKWLFKVSHDPDVVRYALLWSIW